MLAILQDHLSLTALPAMYELYDRATDLFEKFDLEDYQLGYESILVSADGAIDGVSTASDDAIYNLTMQYLKQIAMEHQIRLSVEAKMLNYIQVLEFVKQIEFTELVQDCVEALTCEDFDNLDKFARCLLMVSSIPEEDSMMFLEYIPDCVIATMTKYFSHRAELEVETDALDPRAREVYREMDKYARVIRGQEMRSYKYLFEEEGSIELPFEYHYKANQEYLNALPVEAMIYECVGFAIVSEDGMANPQKTIMDCVGEYIGDLDQLGKIQYEISKTLLEYRNEVASGIGLVV